MEAVVKLSFTAKVTNENKLFSHEFTRINTNNKIKTKKCF